jgi:tetratricopeptide (TPR) repeat protein
MSLLTFKPRWLYERGNAHSSKPLAERALAVCQKCDPTQTQDLLSDIYYSLGAFGVESNDATSSLYYNKLFLAGRLKITEQTNVEDVRLGIANNQIGTSLMMHNKYQEAIGHFQEAIRVYKGLDDFDVQLLAMPVANLGLAYWLQGDLETAASVLEQGLKDREKRWGYDDRESFRTGRLLHVMGNVKCSQGRLDEGEVFHRRALAQYRETIGPDHHRTADVCHRIALHCMRRGELDQAHSLIGQALKVWNADKGVYRNEIARTSFLKSKLLVKMGNNDEAASCFNEARTLRAAILGGQTKKLDSRLVEDDFDQLVTFWSK